MRLLVLLTALSLCLLAAPQGQAATQHVSIGGGYRVDSLIWDIAGDLSGSLLPKLSELEWDPVRIGYISGDYTAIFDGRKHHPALRAPNEPIRPARPDTSAPMFRVWGGWGLVFDGDNRDSDWDIDGIEFSRSENSVGKDMVYDLSMAAGWYYAREAGRGVTWSFSPYVGYGYHAQNFNMENGYQAVSNSNNSFGIDVPAIGPFEGLDSTYDAHWKGALAGLNLAYDMCDASGRPRLRLQLDAFYQWLNYEAEADWNLRTDFAHNPSFKHFAKGTSWAVTTGLEFGLTQQTSIGISVSRSVMTADKDGLDQTFFSDGSSLATKLNQVESSATTFMLTYTARY